MRKVQQLQKVSYPAPDVVTKMVPAPTDGWDAISPKALMDPKRAPILDNWIPRTGAVEVRPGYTVYVDLSTAIFGNDSFTKILLHFDGTNASTTITDSNTGGAAHTWTAAGNAQLSTANFEFPTSSLLLDGTGDWVTTPDSANYTLGSGDFTVDCWVKPAVDGTLLYIAGQGNSTATFATTSFLLRRTSANKLEALVSTGAAFVTVTGTVTSIVTGSWWHVALVRSGNVLTLYTNGIIQATGAFTGSVNDSANLFEVGAGGEVTTTPWNGNIDEFRLSVGVARWTTTFTPSVRRYDIAITGAVDTLMTLRAPSSEKFVVGAGNALYDITSAIPTFIGSGFSSNRWQYVNFRPAGGTAVIQFCNGVDALKQWDGTTLTSPSITGLTGITTADFISIFVTKRRLWYIPNNQQYVVYLATDAVSGAIAGTQDLGPLFSKGGILMTMASWTVDGGSGPNEYTAFISSRGQVAIFYGVDPTSANTWQLVGVFQIAPPIGRRCILQVGSDIAIITLQGILPLSQSLPFDPSADRSVAITQRIQNAMQTAAASFKTNFGWQLIAHAQQALAILNVPATEALTQYQYVMNVLSGAWCRFTGWNANVWELFGDNLYFGGNTGAVNLSFSGGSDNGAVVNLDMQCAYNYFEDPGRIKRMTMIQPLLIVGGLTTPTVLVDADFQDDDTAAPVSTLQGNVLWDVAIWDVALWPPESAAQVEWYSVEALGHALAVRMKLTLNNTSPTAPILQVNAFNVILEMGGFIG